MAGQDELKIVVTDHMNCKSEVGACLKLRYLRSVFSCGRSVKQAVDRTCHCRCMGRSNLYDIVFVACVE